VPCGANQLDYLVDENILHNGNDKTSATGFPLSRPVLPIAQTFTLRQGVTLPKTRFYNCNSNHAYKVAPPQKAPATGVHRLNVRQRMYQLSLSIYHGRPFDPSDFRTSILQTFPGNGF